MNDLTPEMSARVEEILGALTVEEKLKVFQTLDVALMPAKLVVLAENIKRAARALLVIALEGDKDHEVAAIPIAERAAIEILDSPFPPTPKTLN